MPEAPAFEIPYRLETVGDIMRAQREDLLDMGAGYRTVLAVARKEKLRTPHALKAAKRHVSKEFLSFKEETKREYNVRYEEMTDLDSVGNFSLIEAKIPYAGELAEHGNFFAFIDGLLEDLRNAFQFTSTGSLVGGFKTVLALRKLVRREMLSFARTKRTSRPGMTEHLKRLVVATAIYLPENADVLEALRIAPQSDSPEILRQNAITELLFARIPRLMEGLELVEPAMIRKKLFARIEKLGVPARQRASLYSHFPSAMDQGKLLQALEKLDALAAKMPMDTRVRSKLRNYVDSLRQNISQIRSLYKDWFLEKRLARMQKLYKPRDVLKCKITFHDHIVKTCTYKTILDFYPTKDWMDLCKGRVSNDCTGFDLGTRQLLTPNFLNVRIFKDAVWAGNIYMLDLIAECGCLLIDRIQIPRGIDADFIDFFPCLKQVMEELFENAGQEAVVMPQSISNHGSVQKIYEKYRPRLARWRIRLRAGYSKHFASLKQKRDYWVLSAKPSPQRKTALTV